MRTQIQNGIRVTLAVALQSTSVWAQYPGGPGPGPGPMPPPRPMQTYCGLSQIATATLNQRIQNYGEVPLRQALRLDQRCNGLRIRHVIMTASSQMGQAQAVLLVNNQAVSSPVRVVAGRSQPYYFALGNMNPELGYGVQTLQISLRGNVFVESVAVIFESEVDPWAMQPPGPPPPGPQPWPQPGPAPQPNPGSVLLGSTQLAVMSDGHANFQVGEQMGRLSSIELRAQSASFAVREVVVTYGNGQSTREISISLPAGASRRIDLAGGRFIRDIQIVGTQNAPRPMGELQVIGIRAP